MKTLTKTGLIFCALLGTVSVVQAQTDLEIAQYNNDNELLYPGNLAEWIHMGTALGGDYNENAFDPENPGTLGIVQMEPTAYRYFLENGEYANGTMFLLSFFDAEEKSEPQLQGFVQGEMNLQEIHVIDTQRFTEERGFFVYNTPTQGSASKIADGSNCVECHMAEADFNGTFTQFYPTIRDLLE